PSYSPLSPGGRRESNGMRNTQYVVLLLARALLRRRVDVPPAPGAARGSEELLEEIGATLRRRTATQRTPFPRGHSRHHRRLHRRLRPGGLTRAGGGPGVRRALGLHP